MPPTSIAAASASAAATARARGRAPAPSPLETADGASADGLSGVAIDVDTEELTATLHLADGSQSSLTLAELPEDEWIEDCWTDDSCTLAQAFAISPDPVVIGALSIESPVLTTKCGGNLMLQSDEVIVGFE